MTSAPLSSTTQALTLADKIWHAHALNLEPDTRQHLYIDLHLIHEVTTAQAFARLEKAGRSVRRPDLTFATIDHSVPTRGAVRSTGDLLARTQMEALRRNCRDWGIELFDVQTSNQGIVHVVGPELGLTQPGMTIVCGDSHTSTHGALGALAFGIGTTEVEHVLATQTLPQIRPKDMSIAIGGVLPEGVSAKDLILTIIRAIGVQAGSGHIVEYRGPVIEALSIEERMTVCNMTIEAGARAGLIAPDDTTFEYLQGRPWAPHGRQWDEALAAWRLLYTDEAAQFNREIAIDGGTVEPTVTWGTTPAMSVPVSGHVPKPDETTDRMQTAEALRYMGLRGGEAIRDIAVDKVFIGSCTNARISDLRSAARILEGRSLASNVTGIIVPGSSRVRAQAEDEGLDKVFLAAGFEWRESGCSMCIGMNGDTVGPGERCASTSNRNFQNRQGPAARTHLVSPAMAAAAGVTGSFTDVRELL